MFVKIKPANFKKEIIDRDKLFSIGFCSEINSYILTVIVCWRAWYNRYYKITEDERGNSLVGLAEIIIAKHRNGPVDTVNLFFHKQFTKFVGFSKLKE